VRLQAIFDLITGAAIDLSLTAYARNDQRASSDILPFLRPGDLVLRDLGYFVAESFEEITQRGAHFLSRHLATRVLHLRFESGDQQPIDLLEYLQQQAPGPGQVVDLDVTVGSGQKGLARLNCRLVARRVPQAVLEARLRKVRQQEKRLGRQRSERFKKLLAWEIYVTSLSRDTMSVAQMAELYRLRWRIEIVFKALKSHTPAMDLARHRSNPHHVQVLVIAWLCLLVLATRTGSFALAVASKPGAELEPNLLSLLKLAPKVFGLLAVILFNACAPDPALLMQRWLRQVRYHDRYEKRKSRTNMAALLERALMLT